MTLNARERFERASKEFREKLEDNKLSIEEVGKEATEIRNLLAEAKEEADKERQEQQEEIDHLRDQIRDIQARGGRPGGPGERIQTIGERVAEIDTKRLRDERKAKIEHPSLMFRALTHTSSNTDGAFPFQDESSLAIGKRYRKVSFLEMIPIIRLTGRGSVKFLRRTKINWLTTTLNGAVTAADTTITVAQASGIRVGSALTLSPGLAAKENVTVQAVNTTTNVVNISAATNNHADGAEVISDEFTVTAESKYRPVAEIETEFVTIQIYTVGVLLQLSNELYNDAPLLGAHIDLELPHAVRRAVEKLALYGTGSGEWTGFAVDTGKLSYNWSDGEVGDLRSDAVKRAINVAENSERDPDCIVIHPDDLTSIELEKDDHGRRQNPVIMRPDGTKVLHNLVVFKTTSIKSGEALVCTLQEGSTIYLEEEEATDIFEQHGDNVAKNELTVRCQGRSGLAIREPEAFCLVKFNAAPS